MMRDQPEEMRGFVRTSDEDYSYQVGLRDGWYHQAAQSIQQGWGHIMPSDLKEYERGFTVALDHHYHVAKYEMIKAVLDARDKPQPA